MNDTERTGIPKVFIVIDTRIIGGPGRGLFHFLDTVDRTRFDYLLCAFQHASPGSSEFIDACRERGYNLTIVEQRGIRDIAFISRVAASFYSSGCNLLQTHGYKGHVIGYLLRKRLRVPWIAFSHGWTHENIKVRAYNAMGRWCMMRADAIVAVSKPLADEITYASHGKKSALYLPNAINLHQLPELSGGVAVRAQLGIPEDALVLGCIGRLSPEKGQANLIRALTSISRKDIHLLLVGDGPQLGDLQNLAQSCGVKSRCHFLGYISNPLAQFDASDLIVIPSLSEGLPNVLLEALAHRKVVVATPVGEIANIISHSHSGYLASSSSLSDLTTALDTAINDHSQHPSIREVGYAQVSALFDARVRAEKLLDLYKTIRG
jgi:glycosyltransferase involved in cell wall biosynthesis